MKTLRYEDMTAEQWAEYGDCYWCDPNADVATDTDPHDAIEGMIDALYPWPAGLDDVTVTVAALRPRTLDDRDLEFGLTRLLEGLDDEYGNPDGSDDGPTDALRAAWDVFCGVLRKEYDVWACDRVALVEVDAAAWAREHRPEWLEPGPASE